MSLLVKQRGPPRHARRHQAAAIRTNTRPTKVVIFIEVALSVLCIPNLYAVFRPNILRHITKYMALLRVQLRPCSHVFHVRCCSMSLGCPHHLMQPTVLALQATIGPTFITHENLNDTPSDYGVGPHTIACTGNGPTSRLGISHAVVYITMYSVRPKEP